MKIVALTAALVLMASPVLAETHGHEHGDVHHAPFVYRQYHPGYINRGCCWGGGFAPGVGVALGALGLGAYLGSGLYVPPPPPPIDYAPAPVYYPPMPVYPSAPYYPTR